MPQEQVSLRSQVYRFLDQILRKPEESRTDLDKLLLATGRAFADGLLRYEGGPGEVDQSGLRITTLLQSYNVVNAEEKRRNLDAEAIEMFREAK